MASTYTHENFHVDHLPGGFTKEMRDLCKHAVEHGWTVSVKHMTTRLLPPEGTSARSIMLSASQRSAPSIRQYMQQIENASTRAQEVAQPATTKEAAVFERAEREAEHRRAEIAAAAAQADKIVEDTPVEATSQTVKSDDPDPAGRVEWPADLRVVSERPMIAHHAQGKGYPSETTNERRWSDGTVDYTCRFEGCDFAGTKRGSVSAHWRRHVGRGEVEARTSTARPVLVDMPPHEPAYTKGQTTRVDRVAALTAHLAALLDQWMSEGKDADDIAALVAEASLDWVAEQSGSGTALAGEREPMSDEQIVARIRALVDGGEYLRQQAEIDALRAAKDEADQRATECAARAQRATETLRTMRDLMVEEIDDETRASS